MAVKDAQISAQTINSLFILAWVDTIQHVLISLGLQMYEKHITPQNFNVFFYFFVNYPVPFLYLCSGTIRSL